MNKIIIYSYFILINIIGELFMAKKDNKISMPQTGAGLVRYFDEESLGPKISPEHVLVATVILAIFCFVLRYSA
jgi:preprotein translocase subunit Sec61beta